MTTQPIINIEQLQQDIKDVTKLIISKCDPKGDYEDRLIASCHQTISALGKLGNRKFEDIWKPTEKLVHQYFLESAQIISVDPAYLENTYGSYISFTTTKGGKNETT